MVIYTNMNKMEVIVILLSVTRTYIIVIVFVFPFTFFCKILKFIKKQLLSIDHLPTHTICLRNPKHKFTNSVLGV